MNDLMTMEPETDITIDVAAMEATLQRFVVADKISTAMCRASILPAHLRTRRVKGEVSDLAPDEVKANCVLIVNQALRWGVDPFAILPSTFVIGGNLGFDGKLIAAIVNKLGGLKQNLRYEFSGQGADRTVTVTATLRNESEPRAVTVRLKDAVTDNDIWKKDPDQKLCYTGATKWARRHCPHVILGIISDDSPVETIEGYSVRTEPKALPERVEVAAEEAKMPPKPVDINAIIISYRDRINAATTTAEMATLGERINAELALPEQARKDLRAVAIDKYNELVNQESAEQY